MNAGDLERILARLYTDEALRRRFLSDRAGTIEDEGIRGPAQHILGEISEADLELAARVYAHKRSHARARGGWLCRIAGRLVRR